MKGFIARLVDRASARDMAPHALAAAIGRPLPNADESAPDEIRDVPRASAAGFEMSSGKPALDVPASRPGSQLEGPLRKTTAAPRASRSGRPGRENLETARSVGPPSPTVDNQFAEVSAAHTRGAEIKARHSPADGGRVDRDGGARIDVDLVSNGVPDPLSTSPAEPAGISTTATFAHSERAGTKAPANPPPSRVRPRIGVTISPTTGSTEVLPRSVAPAFVDQRSAAASPRREVAQRADEVSVRIGTVEIKAITPQKSVQPAPAGGHPPGFDSYRLARSYYTRGS